MEISLKTPQSTPELMNQIATLGYDLVQLIQTLENIRYEISVEGAQRPSVAWQIKKGFLKALASKQPNQVHFAIAQEAMKDEEITCNADSVEYKEIINIIAHQINEHCRTLFTCLMIPIELKDIFDSLVQAGDEATNSSATFEIIDLPLEIDHLFEKDELFIDDQTFLLHLKQIGKNGKEVASNLTPLLKGNLAKFKKTGKNTLSFWLNTQPSNERPIFLSDALILLAKSLWRDTVSKKASLILKGIPTFIENDQDHIIALLSRNTKIEEAKNGNHNIINEGSLLGLIPIPMIDSELHATILNGIKKINTVEGHRLLRFVPRTAFYQMINLDPDHRIIKRDSYSEIASELGLKSKCHVPVIKEILHAMAYLEFKRPKFSGNLITLKKTFSQKTHRLDGVEIGVGTILLPHRSSEDLKNGESRLLIPIMSDPILVGSNQYHAGQFLLQMKIMGEFCKQSVGLANKGFIEITHEQWTMFAMECNVLPILPRIIAAWTQDGSAPRFLKIIDKNLYTLGDAHKKELEALINTGKLRIRQSMRGIASAQAQQKKKISNRSF